jgi:hypothetical protein
MNFNVNTIAEKLNKKYPESLEEINSYCNYCLNLLNQKDRNGSTNPWMSYKTDDQLIDYFCIVKREGLVFDGKHITLQYRGISYDYIAYKNKMFLVYPGSIFDVQLVYKDDIFEAKKESGKVIYNHQIVNPFTRNEKDFIGGYCVIKNKRGEYLTTLNRNEINKHRKIAKTDAIWDKWLVEMAIKTLVKKACKLHFDDIFKNIETIDNENYDLDKPTEISIKTKQDIETIKTIDELSKYYHANKEKNSNNLKDFAKALSKRKEEITNKKKDNKK